MTDQLKLNDVAQAAFDRALDSGSDKDVGVAARVIYDAAKNAIGERGVQEDPVLLSFLITLARKVRALEERTGTLLAPPGRT